MHAGGINIQVVSLVPENRYWPISEERQTAQFPFAGPEGRIRHFLLSQFRPVFDILGVDLENAQTLTPIMQLSLKHPAEIMSFLTALTGDRQTGEVLLQSSEQSAKVYLNDGLVLWAFATGQEESFQSILIRENHLTKEELLEGIKGAREKGKKNLDEILVALGVDNSLARSSIIERHTRSALLALRSWTQCQAQFNSVSAPAVTDVQGLELQSLLGEEAPPAAEGHRDAAAGTGHSDEETQILGAAEEEFDERGPRPSYGADIRPTVEVHTIPEILAQFRLEIPDFLAAMVIDGETGMPIASLSDIEELDLEVVSAFFRNISKSAFDALLAMGKSVDMGCPLEEIMITSEDEFALMRVLKNGDHFLYVAIEKNSNPGMARVAIRRYLEQINELL